MDLPPSTIQPDSAQVLSGLLKTSHFGIFALDSTGRVRVWSRGAAVAGKRFREDLYYRLSMVEVQVPPLADRKEDLPLLQRHFIDRLAAQYKKEIRGLTHRAQVRLSLHNWPGNVRKLENVLGHACMMALGGTLDVQDLPAYMRSPTTYQEPRPPLASGAEVGALAEQERLLIIRALETAGGNQSQAARSLRIGRDALRYKVKKYHLESSFTPPAHAAWRVIRLSVAGCCSIKFSSLPTCTSS